MRKFRRDGRRLGEARDPSVTVPKLAAAHVMSADAYVPPLPPDDPALPVDAASLAACRDELVRHARLRLGDAAAAEDAVHEVFLAVLSGRAPFEGRSALRTWLIAILRRRIVDAWRARRHDVPVDDEAAEDALRCPGPLPERVAEAREELAQTLERIAAMPAALRNAMVARFVDDRPTEDACRALGITARTLFVRVHRARERLRVG